MIEMTSRQRMLAAINSRPVDRLPFWPKTYQAYKEYQTDPRFADWTVDEFHEYFGSDLYVNTALFIKLDPESKSNIRNWTEDDEHFTAFVLGDKELISSESQGHPTRFPIKTKEDIEFMTQWYNNAKYTIDQEKVEQQKQKKQEIGSKGILVMNIPRSPLMRTIGELADIVESQYLLMDYPDEMEELFSAMHNQELEILEEIVKVNICDALHIAEDTSTTTISPAQYRKYTKVHISDYVSLCNKHGKILIVHMCGHILDILSDLGEINIKTFEAFTSPPVGNTHLIDGREKCPNTCLIGGTNAALWLQPVEEIIKAIKEELDALPHHRGIIISSAGVMPPGCRPETIKKVGEFVKKYKVKN